MAVIAIFIIGADILLLWSLAVMSRFAIKYSNFNGMISNLMFKNTVLLSVLLMVSCGASVKKKEEREKKKEVSAEKSKLEIKTGAENTYAYLPLLKNKKVGIVTNQTGIVSTIKFNAAADPRNESITHVNESLVDYLIIREINIIKIFAPEHGFRGTADAGEHVVDGRDLKTGLPII